MEDLMENIEKGSSNILDSTESDILEPTSAFPQGTSKSEVAGEENEVIKLLNYF